MTRSLSILFLALLLTGCWSDRWGDMPWTSQGLPPGWVPATNGMPAHKYHKPFVDSNRAPALPAIATANPAGFSVATSNGCEIVVGINRRGLAFVVTNCPVAVYTNVLVYVGPVPLWDSRSNNYLPVPLYGSTNLNTWYYLAQMRPYCPVKRTLLAREFYRTGKP